MYALNVIQHAKNNITQDGVGSLDKMNDSKLTDYEYYEVGISIR